MGGYLLSSRAGSFAPAVAGATNADSPRAVVSTGEPAKVTDSPGASTPAAPASQTSDGLVAAPSLPAISTVGGDPSSSDAPLDSRYLTTYVPGMMHLYNIKVTNADGSPVPACDIAVQIMHLLQRGPSPTHAQVAASLALGGGLNDAFNQFTGNDQAGVELLSACALERVP